MFLPIAVLGYIFNASAILIDKLLVEKSIPQPAVYTFYLGILGSVTLLLIPFIGVFPTSTAILFAFASGITFVFGWLSFFNALKFDEPSRVSPIVGTMNAIFTFIIGFTFFSQTMTLIQMISVLVLIFGMSMLSSTNWYKSKLMRKQMLFMIFAAFFFAYSNVLLRETFIRSDFLTGLVLTRIAMLTVVISFLFVPTVRKNIFHSNLTKHNFVNSTSKLLILGQISGAIGGFLLSFSISLAQPAIINSMQGVQYIFILAVVLLLSKKYQHLLDEQMTKKTKLQKLAGAVIIGIGLAILAINS